MPNRLRPVVALLLWIIAAGPLPVAGQGQGGAPLELTLEDIHASAALFPHSFQSGRWAEEGPVVTYVEAEASSGATNLVAYNLETGERTVLIDGRRLRAPDVDRLIEIEGYEYSADGRRVLLYTDSEKVWRDNTKGFYYVFDLEAGTLQPVAPRAEGLQMFAKFSPDGDAVAFVRDRDLFVRDLETMRVTRLTNDGSPGGIINGTTDWVYEEEFHFRDGFAWSPDGRYLAFVKLDESQTRDFQMADLRGQYPVVTQFRFPKAGEANSEIQVGVVEVATGTTRFFDTDTWKEEGSRFEYIPRFGWTPGEGGEARVWIMRMDRDQNDLELLYGDPEALTVETVLTEAEESWIDLRAEKLTFLEDGEHFVWRSETDGFSHLYLYEADGDLVGQLTEGSWEVTAFHGLDEARGILYFTATKATPLERHLYRAEVSLARGEAGEPVQVTTVPGVHEVDFSTDLRYYIDRYSNVEQPPVAALYTAEGEQLKVLQSNEVLAETMAAYELPTPTFLQVPGADGGQLNATLIVPRDYDPTQQYPLLMHVYGGPGDQEVLNQWAAGQGLTRYLWHHYLANRFGLVVATVDNRGTGGRGKAFESATYRRLGQLEAADQIAAAQWFARQPYIDGDRIGLWGWSYGGYSTLLSMLIGEGPEIFRMGIAVAPVTDWRLYDTIYTERYLSTPQSNPAGYDEGAPVNHAEALREDQRLLIIHGDLDDNVHLQNTIQMVDALQQANKQFDLMIYPGTDHGIVGPNTRLHLFTLATDYVREHLVERERPQRGGTY